MMRPGLRVGKSKGNTRQDLKKNDGKSFLPSSEMCRNEATRTPDPYVPNVVRYQLRYIPSLAAAKILQKLIIHNRKHQNSCSFRENSIFLW